MSLLIPNLIVCTASIQVFFILVFTIVIRMRQHFLKKIMKLINTKQKKLITSKSLSRFGQYNLYQRKKLLFMSYINSYNGFLFNNRRIYEIIFLHFDKQILAFRSGSKSRDKSKNLLLFKIIQDFNYPKLGKYISSHHLYPILKTLSL